MTSRRIFRAAAAVAAALTLGATAARAQSPIKLGLAGGLTTPMENTADFSKAGYNGTVTLALNAPLFPVGVRVDGMFNQLQGKDGALSGLGPLDLSVSSVNANLTYNVLPLPVARLYLIGGVGYYRTELKDSGVDAENNVGYNGGAGLRIGTGRTQIFVEARYHRVEVGDGDRVEIVPVTIGFLF